MGALWVMTKVWIEVAMSTVWLTADGSRAEKTGPPLPTMGEVEG